MTGGADSAWVAKRRAGQNAEVFRVRLGGEPADTVHALAVDKRGAIYAAGAIVEKDTQLGFLTVLNGDWKIVSSTRLPGPAYALALDGEGKPCVAGDGFVMQPGA